MEACTSMADLSVSGMYQLCGEPVAVDLVNKKTICGNVYTFDPINRSVVIIAFAENGKPRSVKVIPGEAVKYLRRFADDNSLPEGCLKRTPELESWLGKLLKTAPESSKQVAERKKRLINWLEQNQIHVKNNTDGSISMFGSVRVVEPFTADDCFCDNAIILSRIKQLIEKVPEVGSSGSQTSS